MKALVLAAALATTGTPSPEVDEWKRNPCMGGYKWKCLPRYEIEQPTHDQPLHWKCHWIKRGVRSCKR
jgi:hypothetical protein